MITLASTSRSRRTLLENAGLKIACVAPGVDETLAKQALLADGLGPRDIADALAELKALKASRRVDGLVIGADQTLDLDGALIDKAADIHELRSILLRLRGRPHWLHSAVVVAQGGVPVWRTVRSAKLTVRDFSEAWLDGYLEACGAEVQASVGGYHLEGLGIQLFTQVDGDYFTILGLPLLELLDFLRLRGEMPT